MTAQSPSAPHFLLTRAIPEAGVEILRAAGEVTILDELPGEARLKELLASGEYDAAITQMADKVTADVLSTAKIRGLSNFAVGYNNIDVSAATEAGIGVGNTPGVLTDATADIAFLLLLGTARRVLEGDALARSGAWTGPTPFQLLGADVTGARLGIAGFGRIGKAMARRALGFGMEVVFTQRPPHIREVSDEELGDLAGRVEQVEWQDMLETCDYISLHCPLTDETKHLVDAAVLKAMKPSAILINTSRGPVVDEAALVQALKDGEIAAAGLDVYENEPALAEGLAELQNVLLLPHIGSATVPVRDKMAVMAAENVVAMARGEKAPHPVN